MNRLALLGWSVLALGLLGSGCTDKNGPATPAGPSLIDQYNSAKQLTDPEERAEALIAVGFKQLDAQDSGSAELSFKEGMRAIEDIRKAPAAQARLYLAVASGYQRAGSKSKASGALDGAAEAIDKIEAAVSQANQLASLGAMYGALGDPDAALAAAKKAEKLLDKITQPLDKIDVLAAVMRAYGTAKNQAELDRVVKAANELAASQERPSDNARVLLRVATAQASIGQTEAAVATLNKAAGVARGVSDNALMQAHVLFEAAETANAIGQQVLCKQLLSEADDAAKKTPEGGEIIGRIQTLRGKLGF